MLWGRCEVKRISPGYNRAAARDPEAKVRSILNDILVGSVKTFGLRGSQS